MFEKKLISSYKSDSPGFGAGSGDTERYEYECPCSKGHIVEEHDNIPGFREHDVYLRCDICQESYSIDTSQGVRNWTIAKKKDR